MSSHDRAASRPTTRRTLLGACGLALATGLAGCSGRVVTGGDVAFEAAPAGVASATLDNTGYERYDRAEEVVTREYTVAGVTREVRVTNVVTSYDRALDLGALGRYRAGVFTVVSSPQVRFLWETFNPLGEMSTDEVAARVDDRYESVRNVSRDRTYQVPILGEERTVTRYTAEAVLVDGQVAVEIYLYVTDVARAGEDFVVAVGAHPRVLDGSGAMLALAEALEHGA
ncbi:DUF6517 family protein [Halobium salinum]|uniref:DUF6517 family protein n=1 Tax=Halobium salinum TaxID=1364940 RepID=A0ABD5P897_9EURY|nr:DUF6517 family protein [Halobium salinum]